MNKIDELKKLKTLLDEGAISEDEYNSLKKKIINDKEENMSSDENKNTHLTENTSSRTDYSFDNKNNRIPSVNSYNNETIPVENIDKLKWTLSELNSILMIIVPIIIIYRYDFSILTLVIAGILMGLIYYFNKMFYKQKGKLNIIILTLVIALFIFIPIGTDSDSSSNNSDSNTEMVNDDDYVRNYITNHIFELSENGIFFTLKFSKGSGGRFGTMTMQMGNCTAFYRFETNSREISLNFDSSNCADSGNSTTATFNQDNTISLYYRGEEFRFNPR